jgi:predicted nucleic acid-binding protein
MSSDQPALFDAGVFIAALLKGDPRHAEARRLVEEARLASINACATVGILSEVFAALTWEKAQPRHSPSEAAEAIRTLLEAPSAIRVLGHGTQAAMLFLDMTAAHDLTARRVHDARHVATALAAGVKQAYTYDTAHWEQLERDGLHIVGPPSALRGRRRALSH